MDPTYSPDAAPYRGRVQRFLAEKLPSDWAGIGQLPIDEASDFVTSWRTTLYEAGYLAPGWPVEYGGGGLSALEQVILAEEFAKAGVPTGGPNDPFGIHCSAIRCSCGAPTSRSGTTSHGSCLARTPGARDTPSRTPVPTSVASP